MQLPQATDLRRLLNLSAFTQPQLPPCNKRTPAPKPSKHGDSKMVFDHRYSINMARTGAEAHDEPAH